MAGPDHTNLYTSDFSGLKNAYQTKLPSPLFAFSKGMLQRRGAIKLSMTRLLVPRGFGFSAAFEEERRGRTSPTFITPKPSAHGNKLIYFARATNYIVRLGGRCGGIGRRARLKIWYP